MIVWCVVLREREKRRERRERERERRERVEVEREREREREKRERERGIKKDMVVARTSSKIRSKCKTYTTEHWYSFQLAKMPHQS